MEVVQDRKWPRNFKKGFVLIVCFNTVFEYEIKPVSFGGFDMGWFPFGDHNLPGATGTLIKQESYVPSEEGPLVYFYSEDVQVQLDRVEAAGGHRGG